MVSLFGHIGKWDQLKNHAIPNHAIFVWVNSLVGSVSFHCFYPSLSCACSYVFFSEETFRQMLAWIPSKGAESIGMFLTDFDFVLLGKPLFSTSAFLCPTSLPLTMSFANQWLIVWRSLISYCGILYLNCHFDILNISSERENNSNITVKKKICVKQYGYVMS